MEQALRRHIEETKAQEQRIDDILDALGTDRSLLKDMATQFMGNMAAIAHAPAGDEILKNTFANAAVESFEIAAYKSLFTICDGAGQGQVISLLQPSLQEEQAMAAWLDDNVEEITRTYMRLRQETRDPSH
jgi:ferritin-like metal-binding protein YciE